MKPKTITLLYFSPTETTRKTLEEIAKGIGTKVGNVIDITKPDIRNQPAPEFSNELVLIGAPVYSGRLPKEAADYFKTITASETPAILVVSYGNRAFEDALLELKDITAANGFIPLAGAAFIGEHSFCNDTFSIAPNRPDKEDLSKAFAFGKDITNLLRRIERPSDVDPVDVPGNFPYKESVARGPFEFIAVTDDCDSCGICLPACPKEAIDEADAYSTIDEKCIHCCACIKVCPKHARVMKDSPLKDIAKWLSENFSKRKEPELFFAVE